MTVAVEKDVALRNGRAGYPDLDFGLDITHTNSLAFLPFQQPWPKARRIHHRLELDLLTANQVHNSEDATLGMRR